MENNRIGSFGNQSWCELKEWEDKPHTRKKYLEKTHLIKDYYAKYTKNSHNWTIRKQTIQFKNGSDLKWYLTKKDVVKHMKWCFISYVIREMQIKTTKNATTYLVQ